ncbi:hypothetical protein HZS61_009149 [Fusarium oxysporum f. sp. conglutinans]|uniref:Uncharacterized protein n=2 Tax=Fusarium oxysporum TaxID=5507 RepID=A0A8H6GZ13_FUSOX|nr:hypothetical protein HZS61_009149 [Fusarium oxysporum f. sp. conglutinans]KAG7435402.1 hypothetical protein Forpi1262_v002282 [Fusarium oxysporum f. sp. raphani]
MHHIISPKRRPPQLSAKVHPLNITCPLPHSADGPRKTNDIFHGLERIEKNLNGRANLGARFVRGGQFSELQAPPMRGQRRLGRVRRRSFREMREVVLKMGKYKAVQLDEGCVAAQNE